VRDGIGLTANVVQRSTLRFSEVAVDQAALILLRHGVKTLNSGSRQWTARRGDALVVAGGQTLDIRNRLSPDGLYEARWVVWDPDLLTQQHLPPARRTTPLSSILHLTAVGDAFTSAVERAVEAIEKPAAIPAPVARHRMTELLLWLQEHGVTLVAHQPASIVARLRTLFSTRPGAAWALSATARQFGMSSATLRRRLADEGMTFGDVLADARMSCAMTLLQTTRRSISAVASDVGYASPSRFSVRFRARFGFAPSAIRGHRR
jgi:AraC-like DNA-binding protein